MTVKVTEMVENEVEGNGMQDQEGRQYFSSQSLVDNPTDHVPDDPNFNHEAVLNFKFDFQF